MTGPKAIAAPGIATFIPQPPWSMGPADMRVTPSADSTLLPAAPGKPSPATAPPTSPPSWPPGAGRVLLVNPVYKPGWELPGWAVQEESPGATDRSRA